MKSKTIAAMLIVMAAVACGGDNPDSPAAGTPSPPPASTPPIVAASRVVPTLFVGTFAPYETAGYAVATMDIATGVVRDLSLRDCAGALSFATNPATRLVEIFCPAGALYRLNTETGALSSGPPIAPRETFRTAVACASDGVCAFARGGFGYPALGSDAEVVIVAPDGRIMRSIALPDREKNRVPVAMRVTRGVDGEKFILLTRGVDFEDHAIHILDVAELWFESSCEITLDVGAADFAFGRAYLGIRRSVSGTARDLVVLDAATCAEEGTITLPVTGVGYYFARSVAVSELGVVIAGGNAAVYPANPANGVWTYDLTLRSSGALSTAEAPFAVATAVRSRKIYAGIGGSTIAEISADGMTLDRVHAKALFGGVFFVAEE